MGDEERIAELLAKCPAHRKDWRQTLGMMQRLARRGYAPNPKVLEQFEGNIELATGDQEPEGKTLCEIFAE